MGILSKLIKLLGIYMLLKLTYKVVVVTYELQYLEELNLPDRYGLNSWAAVTGGTSGIGYEFAKQLAQRNFNIVLIARNPNKLNQRAKELETTYKVQVQTIEADFTKNTNVEFYEKIVEKLNKLDLSIMVNNVGQKVNRLVDHSPEDIRDMVITNTLPQTMFTKLLIEKFQERRTLSNKQIGGAFIDVSSVSSINTHYKQALYHGSKAFSWYLTIGQSIDFRGDIDFQSVMPWFTSTNMTNNPKQDILIASPADTVSGSLKCLGQKNQTFGARSHVAYGEFVRFMFEFLPRKLVNDICWDWIMRIAAYY